MNIKSRKLTTMAMLVAVCAVCAQVAIPLPFSPVPLTLSTMAVLLTALLLGPFYGALTIAVYLLAGIVGLPVFAQAKAGIGVFAGPTGGFLWSFLPAAFICGWIGSLGKVRRPLLFAILGCLAAVVLIYSAGVWHLTMVAGLTWKQAFIAGALPYLPLEVIKVFLAATLSVKLKKRGLATF